MTSMIKPVIRRVAGLTAIAGAGIVTAACSVDVTNPGPVQAGFLENKAALAAIVNGAGRNLAEAMNWVGYTGGAVSREIFPAGSTGSFGISVQQQNGRLMDDEVGTQWNLSQQARWTAEDAVTRTKAILGDADAAKNVNVAQALVWAGYANRLLGENMCDGVINGGAKQAASVYLDRAEAHFTEAIAVATAAANANLVSAATAGRASVRLDKNNLTGATADAATIANTFVYRMSYFITDLDQYNRIFWASANQPYRAHTVWNTYYDAYRKATRDPRVPFDSSATQLLGDAAVGSLGRVRWYFQTKHNSQTAPINLSTGWEMRLIEAEARLVGGDVTGAMTILNARRTGLALPALTAANATEAWTALKRERGIELWLEGRRLGDLKRWAALNRPGIGEDMTGRDLCFVTPRSEKETNPNFVP
ncbi:MAG: RagB/SusD family nutrient uptake outer membrane protein [Gemmatimonadetes bacterium]|nr:RagB/SusD family nutrient uptake outer membrane protein [Gemmatimonadota bacterium]